MVLGLAVAGVAAVLHGKSPTEDSPERLCG